jgi:hypothetical protein
LLLTVTTDQGTTQLPYTLPTGTPAGSTVLINESFNSLSSFPSSGSGWTALNAAGPFSGAPAGPASPQWTVATTIPGGGVGSKMAFHANSTGYKWHRLVSPITAAVPAPPAGQNSYVQLDFDIATDTEDEPSQKNTAYDGVTLRITDQTGAPFLARSVLAEGIRRDREIGRQQGLHEDLPAVVDVGVVLPGRRVLGR